MNYSQLKWEIQRNPNETDLINRLLTEIHLRIAIAFAPLAFVILGIGMGVRFKKGAKSISIGLSLVIILLYYGLFIFSVALSSQGFMPPFILTWFPNALTFAVGGTYYYKMLKV